MFKRTNTHEEYDDDHAAVLLHLMGEYLDLQHHQLSNSRRQSGHQHERVDSILQRLREWYTADILQEEPETADFIAC